MGNGALNMKCFLLPLTESFGFHPVHEGGYRVLLSRECQNILALKMVRIGISLTEV